MSDENPRIAAFYVDLTGLDERLTPERVRAVHEAVRHMDRIARLARQGDTSDQMVAELSAASAALADDGVSTVAPSDRPYVVDLHRVEVSFQEDGLRCLYGAAERIAMAAELARAGNCNGEVDDRITRALREASTALADAAGWFWD